MKETIGNGTAPCVGCGKQINNIPYIIETKEDDGNGGYWFRVFGNAKCLSCGEPLNWYHVPPQDSLVFCISQTRKVLK